MNRTTRHLTLSAFFILAAAPAARAAGVSSAVIRIIPLTAMAVQPDLPLELRKYMPSSPVQDLKHKASQEMALAMKERDRGNRKAMEAHLKKAAEFGSKEALILLKALKPSRK